MMIVAQSLSNLRGTYGHDGAQNFLANCRLQLFMAPADSETPDYVSKAIGNFTRKTRSKSWMMGQIGKSNIQEREEGARLLRPEDLRNLSGQDCVLLIQDSNPVRAQKVIYFEDRELSPLFSNQKGHLPLPTSLTIEPQEVISAAGSTKSDRDEDGITGQEFDTKISQQMDIKRRIQMVREKISG